MNNKNIYKSLSDFISESTFYKDPKTKQDFLSKPENLGTAFMFSFLGPLGLLNGAKNKQAVLNYFKSDKQLRIANIIDNNNNTSLILRLMQDANAFKSPLIVNELTKFLVIMKGGRIDTVKDDLIRAVVNGIKSSFIDSNFDTKLKNILKNFVNNSGSLHELTTRLLKIKSSYPPNITSELVSLSRLAAFEELKDIKALDDENETDSSKETNKLPEKTLVKLAILSNIFTTFTSNPDFFDNLSDFQKQLLFFISGSVNLRRVSKSYSYFRANSSTWEKLSEDVLSKYTHELNAAIIPAIDELTEPDLAKILKERWDDRTVNDKVETSHLFLTTLIKRKKDMFINVAFDLQRPEIDDIFDIFDDAAINEIFGSYKNVILEIEKNINTTVNDIYIKILYRLSSRPGFKDEKELLCDLGLSKLVNIFDKTQIFRPGDSLALAKLSNGVSETIVERHISKIYDFYKRLYNSSINDFKQLVDKFEQFIDSGVYGKTENSPFILISKKYLVDLKLLLIPEKITMKDLVELNSNYIDLDTNRTFFEVVISKLEPPIDENKRVFVLKMFTDNVKLSSQTTGQDIISLFEKISKLLGANETEKTYAFKSIEARLLFSSSSTRASPESNKKSFLDFILYKEENDFDLSISERVILDYYIGRSIFSAVSADYSLKFLQAIVNKPNGYIAQLFSKEKVKQISSRENKNKLFDFYFGLLFDNLEKDPGLVDKFYETMDPYFQNKARSHLLSTKSIAAIINKGPIFPQEVISNDRLKEILSFNDIDIEAGLSELKLPRKGKNQTISQYLTAAKPILDKVEEEIIGKLKVEEQQLSKIDLAKITVDFVNSTYAGKHGNIYPKFLRMFKVSLSADLYNRFAKELADSGLSNEHIISAFHGTGGVAASMILRYGFKAISAADPSVVGRMLGEFRNMILKRAKNDPNAKWELSATDAIKDLDNYEYTTRDLGGGIYFAKNIDKSLQYVGNNGYTRGVGTKGYIFVMDAQLGVKGEHYRAAGLGNDAIKSPEWAVADGNTQLKILLAYEVEIIDYDGYSELKQLYTENYEERLSFKTFYKLNESIQPSSNQQRFVFWDGNIPLLNGKIVPFEKVKSLGKRNINIEITPNGPAVVFYNTKKTEIHDIRYANAMKDHIYHLYFSLLKARQ